MGGPVRMRLPTLAWLLAGCAAPPRSEPVPVPPIPWAPRGYVCYRAERAPAIDGRLDEAAWRAAPRSERFVDIEGYARPPPPLETRVRILWDDDALYVAAEMEEPDVSGFLTKRDSVIFQDNDFEIFLDPDGDARGYFEIEINALGTVWDLLLPRTYRDGGRPRNEWDARGLRSAVGVEGTVNDPSDRDRGWTLEVALPWRDLARHANRPVPPAPGDRWRINFSRVQWRYETDGGRYAKVRDPTSGKPLPEENWVWSPQGLIAMHYPEMWGFLQFSGLAAGRGTEPLRPPSAEERSAYDSLRRRATPPAPPR
jgi:hypothetical protein